MNSLHNVMKFYRPFEALKSKRFPCSTRYASLNHVSGRNSATVCLRHWMSKLEKNNNTSIYFKILA